MSDKIKKGLECCSNVNFVCNEECPYYKSLSEGEDCCLKKNADALALIQQLEAQNAELLKKFEQLQAERDAAVKDLLIGPTCETCMHQDKGRNDSPCDACVENTIDYSGLHWQWRCVQKED